MIILDFGHALGYLERTLASLASVPDLVSMSVTRTSHIAAHVVTHQQYAVRS